MQVSATLNPGMPQTVSFKWEIPPGTPQHSCIFAVVRSPAEPEKDITSLVFGDVEALVRSDNDWVQRNLQIANYSSANLSEEESNKVWTAPIFLIYPSSEEEPLEPLPVHPRVTAMDERGSRIKHLVLDVPGIEQHELDPVAVSEFNLGIWVEAGHPLPLLLQATIPAHASVGDVFNICIDPTFGDIALVGYGHQLRITEPRGFVWQILDIALAAYWDYAELTGSNLAFRLAEEHQSILARRLLSPEGFAEWLSQQHDLFEGLVLGELVNYQPQDSLLVVPTFEQFFELLPKSKPMTIVSSYRDAVCRLQALVYLLYQYPKLYR